LAGGHHLLVDLHDVQLPDWIVENLTRRHAACHVQYHHGLGIRVKEQGNMGGQGLRTAVRMGGGIRLAAAKKRVFHGSDAGDLFSHRGKTGKVPQPDPDDLIDQSGKNSLSLKQLAGLTKTPSRGRHFI
jgi:hypothetical protein